MEAASTGDSASQWPWAVVVYVVLRRTALGYEVRGVGINRTAGSYKGISVPRVTVLVMAISGALAGLAGAAELAGVHHRLQLDISNNFGFVGIIIALIGRLHPAGVVVSAIAFGALVNGAVTMQIQTGIPAALVDVIQGAVAHLRADRRGGGALPAPEDQFR